MSLGSNKTIVGNPCLSPYGGSCFLSINGAVEAQIRMCAEASKGLENVVGAVKGFLQVQK